MEEGEGEGGGGGERQECDGGSRDGDERIEAHTAGDGGDEVCSRSV